MTRFVALLLAFVLPLQFAWGAAAAVCQHEPAPQGARHFGHHEHVHKADGKKAAQGKLSVDSDCGFCHVSGAAAMAAVLPAPVIVPYASSVEVRAQQPYPSALARAPDRPQWLRLA